ncbi:hypothetical protein D918_06473 [Trichuris suis]|nr:hypothetical protein D918_06473 [Trichuris suis]
MANCARKHFRLSNQCVAACGSTKADDLPVGIVIVIDRQAGLHQAVVRLQLLSLFILDDGHFSHFERYLSTGQMISFRRTTLRHKQCHY